MDKNALSFLEALFSGALKGEEGKIPKDIIIKIVDEMLNLELDERGRITVDQAKINYIKRYLEQEVHEE